MKFAIECTSPLYNKDGEVVNVRNRSFVYDNSTSEIFDESGKQVKVKPFLKKDYTDTKVAKTVSSETPLGKDKIKTLKIQLGLSCNYGCEYCNQRFVPNADHSNSKLVDDFLENLDSWVSYPPEKIEFWGGEPFVYWKILKPLAEALADKYPFSRLSVVTNGSLLTDEIVDWLDDLDFSIAISHDGPGQNVRGPDPLKDSEKLRIINSLISKRLPKGKISFNSMIHRENLDRAKIQGWFEGIFGNDLRVTIGEGGFIDVYDEGSKANTLQNVDEHYAFRRLTMDSLRDGTFNKFQVYRNRLTEWIDSFANLRPASVIGQKCGMDKEDTIAVDLKGNVLTCQNVTAISKAPNGKSHKIGHVSKLDEVKLNTSTHWRFREECSNCPMLQMCKGSCMFLQGDYFKLSCDSAYSDHIPFFAAAFENATGCLPYAIKAIDDSYSLAPERENLWGPDKDYEIPRTREVSI